MTQPDEVELHGLDDSAPAAVWLRRGRIVLVLAIVALSTIRAVPIARVGDSAAARLRPAYDLTASEQRWSMFSNPSNMSRSVRAQVRFEDGKVRVWELPAEPRWQVLRFRRGEKLIAELQDPDNYALWPALAAMVAEEAAARGVVAEVVLERMLVNPPNLEQPGGATVRLEPFYSSVDGRLPWDVDGYAE